MYWNISLDAVPANRWKWSQNSLISVNRVEQSYQYNPEYYLMKHFSHFVKVGAMRLPTLGDYDNILAFRNPDGELIILTANELPESIVVRLRVGEELLSVELSAGSLNTFVVSGIKRV
jgi:glucosylceramidase